MKLTLTVLSLLMFSTFAFAENCPTSISASCTANHASGSSCFDVVANTVPSDKYKQQCESEGNKFSSSPCVKTNLVGSCVLSYNNQDAVVMRIYKPMNESMVSMICSQSKGKVCQ